MKKLLLALFTSTNLWSSLTLSPNPNSVCRLSSFESFLQEQSDLLEIGISQRLHLYFFFPSAQAQEQFITKSLVAATLLCYKNKGDSVDRIREEICHDTIRDLYKKVKSTTRVDPHGHLKLSSNLDINKGCHFTKFLTLLDYNYAFVRYFQSAVYNKFLIFYQQRTSSLVESLHADPLQVYTSTMQKLDTEQVKYNNYLRNHTDIKTFYNTFGEKINDFKTTLVKDFNNQIVADSLLSAPTCHAQTIQGI